MIVAIQDFFLLLWILILKLFDHSSTKFSTNKKNTHLCSLLQKEKVNLVVKLILFYQGTSKGKESDFWQVYFCMVVVSPKFFINYLTNLKLLFHTILLGHMISPEKISIRIKLIKNLTINGGLSKIDAL